MPPGYHCPHCHAQIDLADTNIATDLALCRACGRPAPFSIIVAQNELATVNLSAPPQGLRVESNLIEGITLTYRKTPPVVFLLIPFTALWSGFSMWGIYGRQIAQEKFDLGTSLFGLPFLAGTIFLVSLIFFMLFGCWRIRVGRGYCRAFVGIGPLGRRREISLAPGTEVRLDMSSLKRNHVAQREIVVASGDDRIKFGAMLPDPARVFIAATLQRAIRAH
jgi:hypothetical protein